MNNTPSPTDSIEGLDQFITEMIAPFSIHRKKYARPHGTVARGQFHNRMNKRLKQFIASEVRKAHIEEAKYWEHNVIPGVRSEQFEKDVKKRLAELKGEE